MRQVYPLKIDSIEVEKAIHNARQRIDQEQGPSSFLHAALEVLLLLVTVLINRTTLT